MDPHSLAEIHQFHLSILSALKFHQANYAAALPLVLARRAILSVLASQATSSHEQALAEVELDKLSSIIRFSAYKLGRARQAPKVGSDEVEEIANEFSEADLEEDYPGLTELLTSVRSSGASRLAQSATGGDSTKLNTIVWNGQDVKVKSPEIVRALIKVQGYIVKVQRSFAKGKKSDLPFQWNALPSLGRGNLAQTGVMKKFDRLLAALIEAESISRRQASVESHTSSSSGIPSTSSSDAPPGSSNSLDFIHQYIIYLLLSWRIRRDMILSRGLWQPTVFEVVDTVLASTTNAPKKINLNTSSGKAAAPHALGRNKKRGLLGAKKDQALRNLQAIVKISDAVLQSTSQMTRDLGIISERGDYHEDDQEAAQGLASGIERIENWARGVRCIKLAEFQALVGSHKDQLVASVHLTDQASLYLRKASQGRSDTTTSDPDIFYHLSSPSVARSVAHLATLSDGLKRALFALTQKKPVFYDLAFNYVDFPVEQVKAAAGLEPTSSTTKAADKYDSIQHLGLGSAGGHGATVSRGRESTPAPGTPVPANKTTAKSPLAEQVESASEDEEGQEEEQEERPSKSGGWFGGFFGGRK